jgi:hypothetical protein
VGTSGTSHEETSPARRDQLSGYFTRLVRGTGASTQEQTLDAASVTGETGKNGAKRNSAASEPHTSHDPLLGLLFANALPKKAETDSLIYRQKCRHQIPRPLGNSR